MTKTTDRLEFAAKLSRGKRVLDIGGRGMAPCDRPGVYGPNLLKLKGDTADNSPFARSYHRIAENAKDYRVLDIRNEPDVQYVVNLSEHGCVKRLHDILCDYQPELILCMETLEHVSYHYEVLNEIAGAVSRYGSAAFITLPNNKNWIFNVLGWNHDHIIAFFPDIADRFIRRSDLSVHDIQRIPCFQKYLWYWWLAYALSGFQSFSIGFLITPHNQRARI
ncbi:MAG: hypothetical protein WCI03_02435 [bacterium]